MRPVLLGLAVAALAAAGIASDDKGAGMGTPLTGTVKGIDGKDIDLGKLRGKVVLVVNVASQCGYTPQYKGLQALYEKHAKDGLVVLGVPSNDFGGQEPDDNPAIEKFCQSTYKVTFPLLAKVPVKGGDKSDLYKALTDPKGKFPGEVKWNFEKFLVGRSGEVVGRFKSGVEPTGDELTAAVKRELAAQ